MQINFPALNCMFPVDLQHLHTWQAEPQLSLRQLQMMRCQRELRRGPVARVVARKKTWPVSSICFGHALCWVPRQAAMILAPCIKLRFLPPSKTTCRRSTPGKLKAFSQNSINNDQAQCTRASKLVQGFPPLLPIVWVIISQKFPSYIYSFIYFWIQFFITVQSWWLTETFYQHVL